MSIYLTISYGKGNKHFCKNISASVVINVCQFIYLYKVVEDRNQYGNQYMHNMEINIQYINVRTCIFHAPKRSFFKFSCRSD